MFTLKEFETEAPNLSFPSESVNGELMEFATFDDAVGMATFLAEDPGMFPLVAIIQNEVENGEETGWSAGWVERHADGTTSVHEGDYENDPDWDALRAMPIVEA